MEKFEKAYLKFLQRYKDESWFAGAILCGSFATGNNDSNSDIDIFMVSKNTDWRERGTVLTDGFIVEYFINPIGLIEKEIISEQYSLDKCTSTMFNQGIVIYDEFGQVKKLKDLAKNTLKEQSIINEYQFKMNCYAVWESFDELDSKFKNNQDIDLCFYHFIQCALAALAYNKCIGTFNINKIERFLVDEAYRKKYGITKFFNQKEIDILVKSLTDKTQIQKYENAKNLYEYICKEFDFDIANFSHRTKI